MKTTRGREDDLRQNGKKKELDLSRKVQIDDEAEKKIEDTHKTKIAVTVDVIKSKDGNTAENAVFGGRIIDVDSDDENDEVYLKVCNL